MEIRRLTTGISSWLLLILLPLILVSCRSLQPPQKAEQRISEPVKVEAERFFEAAAQGDLEQIRELLDRNPDLLEARDPSGWNALSYAAWGAHPMVHEYLIRQGAEGNLYTEAALGPWQSFLERLDTNPIGVDSRDVKLKAPPLIWAVRSGNQAGCEVLVSRGADLIARDRQGNTVLHHAAMMNRLELLDYFLSIGIDVNTENQRRQTALHLVAASGIYEACRMLIDQGASLQAADDEGNTPLHIAAERGYFELCEYFLFLGAPAEVQNDRGQTPHDLAVEGGYDRVARLLSARSR